MYICYVPLSGQTNDNTEFIYNNIYLFSRRTLVLSRSSQRRNWNRSSMRLELFDGSRRWPRQRTQSDDEVRFVNSGIFSLYNKSKQCYNHNSKMFSFFLLFSIYVLSILRKMSVLSFFFFCICCVQQCSSFFSFFFWSHFPCPVAFCFCFGFPFFFLFFS